MKKITVGSVCSGIEAASVAFEGTELDIKWFSEISDFPSKILKENYPQIPNIGDMKNIPNLLDKSEIESPDLICAGTPCQAFSVAGWKKGLNDDRGNLTLKFVEILDKNDEIRERDKKQKTIALWENVEGVLKDKTNSFGCLISTLIGASKEIKIKKWPSSGIIHGPKRNIAWRVLDAKYFGLPQQRKRLYLIASGKDFFPENIIFDEKRTIIEDYKKTGFSFTKNNQKFEVFRDYTDCLYSAYGTKWNGNAAAYNGSLFISQNNRLRRLTPLECERLMGFPDNYTLKEHSKRTNRYQALGNSWAVPLIKWLGKRIEKEYSNKNESKIKNYNNIQKINQEKSSIIDIFEVTDLDNSQNSLFNEKILNGSEIPENPEIGDLKKIIDTEPDEKLYLSAVGCRGILRRKEERSIKINQRLEYHLIKISSSMPEEEIEKISRIQKRGRLSN